MDLIALAPQLLGFRPRDSVLLMTFGGPEGCFHARVDLPVDPEGQQEVTGLMVGAAARNRVGAAAVLVFSTDAEASRAQARLLVEGLTGASVDVLDVVRVEEDRYFRPLEHDESGTPYDVSAHPFTARRVFEGQVVQPSREALADTLVGTDEADRAAVLDAVAAQGPASFGRGRGREARWVQACLRRGAGGPPLGVADAARLLVACTEAGLRDVAWAEMSRENAATHVDLWRDLVRRAPTDQLPPAAALLGFAAWLAGDGALAWCAVDRCLEVDPDYSLAHGVGELLTRAVPPSTWEQIPQTALAALDRAGLLSMHGT
ncbi:DUF4192 domain-containing protein [Mycobacterium sp.]|uniref:DUF4192 domain-containing protein n=1 Tax=Mycobacterium sp. TaxID=1785 RepID=UPI003D6C4227